MTKKKSKTKGKKLTSKQLQTEIVKLFKRNPKKRLNPKQVSRKLKAENNRDSIQHALEQLVEAKQLIALEDYKFKLRREAQAPPSDRRTHFGVVDMTQTGSAYIICKDLENDVFVHARNLGSALDGDRVEVAVWTPRGRQRPEGEVVRVVERSNELFVGTLHLSEKYGFVTPDKHNMPVDIFVHLENTLGAEDQEKVIVRVEQWHDGKGRSPVGRVTNRLGQEGSNDVAMMAILINNGFALDFPESVQAEAEELPTEVPLMEVHRRRDFREITTFTIDPEDAKDFDDALSIEYLENGHCQIGVHIADVSHYVLAGSALDEEALKRSTSVYLVDRVLPMLPEKLSNELCSLRPNEDKCTFSAVFEFDKHDKLVGRWFGKTVIHSDRRFSYEEAQEVLESGKGDFAEELKVLNRIAGKLRKKRFKEGSIDFDLEEVRFRLDENGFPLEVYTKERKEAHLLIEDFMLLANREVAEFVFNRGKDLEIPFVYRVHDVPDPDKVAELASFAKELGFSMNIGSPTEIARSYNRLTKAAQEDHSLKLLEPLAVRTMAKAEYTSDNIGHYGLGFRYYTHFTSPIRRYSDVLVHRILEKNLDGKYFRTDKRKLEEKCSHVSRQERRAMEAERESIKFKQVEFMDKHVGEVFPGRIAGISDRGFFVALDGNQCEGFVGFDSLDEPFEIEDSRLRARGLRSKRQLKLGDAVRVRIVATNLSRRQIDMALVEE
ncbi:MAG: ribonuclease R [Saprospiraceae bacterium]|nr:ribonuclease R [Saprospiraceae bacterium]